MYNFEKYMKEAKNESNFIELIYSKLMLDILSDIYINKKSEIAKELLDKSGTKSEVSFVDIIQDKDDMISYITSNKAKQILDKYVIIGRHDEGENLCWTTNRQEQRINRFLNRILGNKFSQQQIEDFVNDYKLTIKKGNIFDDFEIIEGEEIRKFYYGGNYSRESDGNLQRSCMRYDYCSPYFNIYVENPTKMKMLILKQNGKKIYGRANLWYLDNPEGEIFMDRIYTTQDWQIKLFIDYAIKNNYIFKSKQIYGGSVIPVIRNGRKDKIMMSVNLKPKDYKNYPYVDTLQFYNPTTGVLTSDIKKFYDKNFITLVTANGGYYIQGDDDYYGIDNLGRIVNMNLLVWSERDNVHIHRDNAVQLVYTGRREFVTQDHEFINIDGLIVLKEDAVFDEEKKKWIIKKI